MSANIDLEIYQERMLLFCETYCNSIRKSFDCPNDCPLHILKEHAKFMEMWDSLFLLMKVNPN